MEDELIRDNHKIKIISEAMFSSLGVSTRTPLDSLGVLYKHIPMHSCIFSDESRCRN